MTTTGSSLGPYGTMNPYDTLVSDNHCFMAILLGDGEFAVYNRNHWDPNEVRWVSGKAGPDGQPYLAMLLGDGEFVVFKGNHFDSNQILWETGVAGPDGKPYLAIMQVDGNFVIYKGTTPTEGQALWATNTAWTLKHIDLSNVMYDLSHAVLSNPQIQNESTQNWTNNTNEEQTNTFTFEVDYTETQSWSTTWGVKIGIETTIKAGIPFFLNGTIKVSAEGTWNTTSGGQQSQTKKFADSIPVKVPPHSQVTCKATASTATVSIPFSADATYWDTSGKSYPGVYTGTYQGTTAYELQGSWTQS